MWILLLSWLHVAITEWAVLYNTWDIYQLQPIVQVQARCTVSAENRGHAFYPRIFIILPGPIYFQASVQPFMQDENNSFSCFLPEHWRSSS